MPYTIPGLGPNAEEALKKEHGVPVELESAGAAITIPAGSTVSEALQIIIDAIDPA